MKLNRNYLKVIKVIGEEYGYFLEQHIKKQTNKQY